MSTLTLLLDHPAVIAVDKPVGLASIPEAGSPDSVLSSLQGQSPDKLYIVHRLDKEVSGVILFARNAPTHQFLNAAFSGREVHKTYVALVHGVIPASRGVIDRPLREFGSGRMGVDPARGKPSLTEFEVVRRFADTTLVQLHPITGRRHQLRVHLYSLGHPIVGDLRYGDRATQSQFPRLMLHSRSIVFPLPSGETLTVEAPTPDLFRDTLNSLTRL